MQLTQQEKELLIRDLTAYYKNVVWIDMVEQDNSSASDEDYRIREITTKLEIRNMFSQEVQIRW